MTVGTCDNCGAFQPRIPHSDSGALDNGWSINTTTLGCYSGFTDDMVDMYNGNEATVHFCHDCCVKLVESFPAFRKNMTRGGHPSSEGLGAEPCCKWAWTIEDSVAYYATHDGKWEKRD
jgi:hypothetical protein